MGIVKNELSKRMESGVIKAQFKLYIASIHSEGLNEILGNPCSKPRMTRIVTMNILDKIKMSEEDLTKVQDIVYKDAYVGLKNVAKDNLVNLMMFLTSAFLARRQTNYAKICLNLVCLTTFGKLQGKYFRYCDKDILNYVLDTSHTKSYVKRYGLAGLISVIAETEFKKYKVDLLNYRDDVYPKILHSIRTRLNQIMKLLAQKYYRAKEQGLKIGAGEAGFTPDEGVTARRADYEQIADSVTHYIARNKTTDEQLLDRINDIYRINKTMGRSIIENMHDIKTHDNLTRIIVLLVSASNIKDLREVCSKQLFEGGKKLISSRKPKSDYKDLVAGYIDESLKRQNKTLKQYSVETKSKLMNAFNFILIHMIRDKFC